MTLSRRHLLAGSAALGIAAATVPFSGAPARAAHTWALLGVHPGAAAQPTDTGKALIDLEIFNGMLFAGYGDYGDNTGPIAINPYSLADGGFLGTRARAYTHQIGVWRRASYGLVAPNIDPLGDVDNGGALDPRGGFSWTTDGLNWRQQAVGPSLHVFDFAESAGSRWAVGSGSVDGAGAPFVWRRQGSGKFQVSLSNADNDLSAAVDRYYWIAVVGGVPYIQARGGASAAPLRRFDSSSQKWVSVAGVKEQLHRSGQPSRLQVLGSRIVSASGAGLRIYTPGRSGITVVAMPNGEVVKDLYVRGSALYTLTTTAVFRSVDGGSTFEFVCTPLSGATSMAVGSANIYLGTASSRLYARSLQ